LEIKDLSF